MKTRLGLETTQVGDSIILHSILYYYNSYGSTAVIRHPQRHRTRHTALVYFVHSLKVVRRNSTQQLGSWVSEDDCYNVEV